MARSLQGNVNIIKVWDVYKIRRKSNTTWKPKYLSWVWETREDVERYIENLLSEYKQNFVEGKLRNKRPRE